MSDLAAEAEPGAADVAVEKRSAAVAGAVQPGARAPGAAAAGAGAGASAQRVPPAGGPLLRPAGHGGRATDGAQGNCTSTAKHAYTYKQTRARHSYIQASYKLSDEEPKSHT